MHIDFLYMYLEKLTSFEAIISAQAILYNPINHMNYYYIFILCIYIFCSPELIYKLSSHIIKKRLYNGCLFEVNMKKKDVKICYY